MSEHVNEVVYGGRTLIDLTEDDVTANDVAEGVKFHLPSGAPAVGVQVVPVPTSANVTPYTTAQTVLPSDYGAYNFFNRVSVNAIAYTVTQNEFGGVTVSIGTVAPT